VKSEAVQESARGGARAPGPPPWRAWRDLLAWGKDHVRPVQRLARQYGGLVHLRMGPLRFYFVQDPELVQECLVTRHKAFKKDRFFVSFVELILGNGLLTSEPPFHLQQRRMIQPAFHSDRIRTYGESMVESAVALDRRWTAGTQVNIASDMMELTLSIVGKTLFNSDVSGDAEAVADAIETILERADIFLIPFFPALLRLPLPRNRAFHHAIAELDRVLYRIIGEHKAAGGQDDVLSMLLAARDEETDRGMTEKQVRDEALTLFTAGHETTSIALTWTWHLLSQHPDVESRLHEELDTVLAGRMPTPGDYPSLPYTQRVFKEALRYYPPTIMVGREAREDTQLGAYPIPRGAVVIMTPYVTHHDPTLYAEPHRFDPDRWLPEASEGRHRFAYFPFGGGQRRCIGESFAWMEGVLVLATLARHWRPRLAPGHTVDLEPRLTMRPKGGIPMVLESR